MCLGILASEVESPLLVVSSSSSYYAGYAWGRRIGIYVCTNIYIRARKIDTLQHWRNTVIRVFKPRLFSRFLFMMERHNFL